MSSFPIYVEWCDDIAVNGHQPIGKTKQALRFGDYRHDSRHGLAVFGDQDGAAVLRNILDDLGTVRLEFTGTDGLGHNIWTLVQLV